MPGQAPRSPVTASCPQFAYGLLRESRSCESITACHCHAAGPERVKWRQRGGSGSGIEAATFILDDQHAPPPRRRLSRAAVDRRFVEVVFVRRKVCSLCHIFSGLAVSGLIWIVWVLLQSVIGLACALLATLEIAALNLRSPVEDTYCQIQVFWWSLVTALRLQTTKDESHWPGPDIEPNCAATDQHRLWISLDTSLKSSLLCPSP